MCRVSPHEWFHWATWADRRQLSQREREVDGFANGSIRFLRSDRSSLVGKRNSVIGRIRCTASEFRQEEWMSLISVIRNDKQRRLCIHLAFDRLMYLIEYWARLRVSNLRVISIVSTDVTGNLHLRVSSRSVFPKIKEFLRLRLFTLHARELSLIILEIPRRDRSALFGQSVSRGPSCHPSREHLEGNFCYQCNILQREAPEMAHWLSPRRSLLHPARCLLVYNITWHTRKWNESPHTASGFARKAAIDDRVASF